MHVNMHVQAHVVHEVMRSNIFKCSPRWYITIFPDRHGILLNPCFTVIQVILTDQQVPGMPLSLPLPSWGSS